MKSVELRKIKEKLKFLEEKYETVVYGSYVEGRSRPDSDIDIAVLSYETNKEKILNCRKNS